MPIGRVVRHEIEDDLQPPRMRLCDERVEIRQRAEQRIDAAIVGNVVTEIGHGRGIDRRYPDGVDAEAVEIVEPPPNAREIADAVTVRILKRPRVDLIDDAALPPQRLVLFRLVHEPAPCLAPPACLDAPYDG